MDRSIIERVCGAPGQHDTMNMCAETELSTSFKSRMRRLHEGTDMMHVSSVRTRVQRMCAWPRECCERDVF